MAPIITAWPRGSLRKLSPMRSLAPRTSKAPAMPDVRKLLLVTVCLRQSGRAVRPARWTPQSVMCRGVSKGACHEASLPSP